MAFKLPNPFAQFFRKTQESEEKKRRREEERRRKEQEADRQYQLFEERFNKPIPALTKIQDLFEEKVTRPVEKITKGIAEKGELFREKIGINKLPEPVQSGLRGGAPGLFVLPEVPRFLSTMFLGTPEERAEVKRIRREGTPEEKKALDMAQMEQLGFAAAVGTGGAVAKRLTMNEGLARQILKVPKGVGEAEIQSAYRTLIKKEYPRTVQEVASRYKTTAAKIVNEAREFLVTQAKRAAEALPKPIPKRLPEEVAPVVEETPRGVDLTKAKTTNEFGFQGQGLKEVTTELPVGDIPKRSITTPEYRDYDVNIKAGRKVTKPIIATVQDINDPNSPIQIVDGWHRWRQAQLNGDKTIPVKYIFKPIGGVEGVGEAPIVKSVLQLEKAVTKEQIQTNLRSSASQEEYVSRITELSKELDKPEVRANRSRLKDMRALANEEIKGITGSEITGNWKQDFALLQTLKQDPELKDAVSALEDVILKVDEAVGNRAKKEYEVVSQDLSLPAEGKFHIPYGKYTTQGTGNKEWVQQNIPLLYMGNKRGMVGYILDVLGVKQKDLPSIVESDVSHLKSTENVVDLFGGSGLLSNLSKRFFPSAKITYNELDDKVLRAIEQAKKEPQKVSRFVSEIALWLDKNPDADWLSHFSTVYKSDENFRIAARLIESAAGRTAEVTPIKLRNLLKAIPNFSKTFKDVSISNKNAWDVLDQYIKSGTSKDFLWLDPPYLWSSGYQVGAEMERTEGFLKLLGKLEKLNDKGVKFVFFNNDPEVQVAKAGLERAHIDNIVGKINQLSEQGMIVVKGVDPLGAGERREMMITNLTHGLENGRLLNLKEVQKAIEALRQDPAAAPREMLKLYRDIRGTSRFLPEGQKITTQQIKIIRALRKSLRIKGREMVPVLDELLGDTSFSKMTKEDGVKMIEWLQPRNWDVIDKKISLTREMIAEERRQAIITDRIVAKDTEMEEKLQVMAGFNRTIGDLENFMSTMRNLPQPEPIKWTFLKRLTGAAAPIFPPDIPGKLMGIRTSFIVPWRTVIQIGTSHARRLERAKKIFTGLTKAEQRQAIYLSVGAKKYIKEAILPKAERAHKYFQEIAEAQIKLINMVRQARGLPDIKGREPYWPFILQEDIASAADVLDRVKFWEVRTKTIEDFNAGLFSDDPDRVISIWAESAGSWLKKNLFNAFVLDRYEAITKMGDPASIFVKQLVEFDIFNMSPENNRYFTAFGTALDDLAGKILPRKVLLDDPLLQSVLNTSIGQRMKERIRGNVLLVPRFKPSQLLFYLPKLIYPAKLMGNIGFYLLNRTQPMAAFPFIGLRNTIAGRLHSYGIVSSWLWNRKYFNKWVRYLEEGGYEYGRVVASQEFPTTKQAIGNVIDKTGNFLSDFSELLNRIESEAGMTHFLGMMEKRTGQALSEDAKMRVGARFSAFINFIGGKGYSPIAAKSFVAKPLYIFAQYPLNQLNIYHEMIKVAWNKNGVKDILNLLGKEGGAPEEFFKWIDKLPPQARKEKMGNFFLFLLSVTLPVAMMYLYSRSWNVAERALPSIPRPFSPELFGAFFDWLGDPTDEEKWGEFRTKAKDTFSVNVWQRAMDALNIKQTGIIQTRSTGRPMFIEQTMENIFKSFAFGRSALPEYEKRFPGILGKILGGYTESGEAEKLRRDREKVYKQETEDAVELMKLLETAPTQEILDKLIALKQAGRLSDGMKGKLRTYIKEQATGTTGLERSITGLKDEDQARFILDKIYSDLSTEELTSLLADYKRRGILTDNVKAEMKRLLKEGKYEQPVQFQNFFQGKRGGNGNIKVTNSTMQQNDEYCGPASLAFVLKKLGKNISQKELAEKLHTKEGNGTDDGDLVRVAKSLGFQTTVYENQKPEETLDALDYHAKQGNPSILDYIMGSDIKDDGHFAVFTEKTNGTVTLWNPWNGKYEKRDKESFVSKWKGTGDDEHKNIYHHWALVISKRKGNKQSSQFQGLFR